MGESLIFFSKPDCPLCDDSFPGVASLAAKFDLGIEKVDIESDAALFEKYRYRIPVVMFRGFELGWGRFTIDEIEERLREDLGV
jgi:thiol-disulfide isomerase/thioredoxin